jgi:IclR family transcriptional regulator, acetate operon repressor
MPEPEVEWSADLIHPKNVAGTALLGKACDILELIGRSPCVYRKLKLGRSGGEVRQGWRVI